MTTSNTVISSVPSQQQQLPVSSPSSSINTVIPTSSSSPAQESQNQQQQNQQQSGLPALTVWIIPLAIAIACIMTGILIWWFIRRKQQKKKMNRGNRGDTVKKKSSFMGSSFCSSLKKEDARIAEVSNNHYDNGRATGGGSGGDGNAVDVGATDFLGNTESTSRDISTTNASHSHLDVDLSRDISSADNGDSKSHKSFSSIVAESLKQAVSINGGSIGRRTSLVSANSGQSPILNSPNGSTRSFSRLDENVSDEIDGTGHLDLEAGGGAGVVVYSEMRSTPSPTSFKQSSRASSGSGRRASSSLGSHHSSHSRKSSYGASGKGESAISDGSTPSPTPSTLPRRRSSATSGAAEFIQHQQQQQQFSSSRSSSPLSIIVDSAQLEEMEVSVLSTTAAPLTPLSSSTRSAPIDIMTTQYPEISHATSSMSATPTLTPISSTFSPPQTSPNSALSTPPTSPSITEWGNTPSLLPRKEMTQQEKSSEGTGFGTQQVVGDVFGLDFLNLAGGVKVSSQLVNRGHLKVDDGAISGQKGELKGRELGEVDLVVVNRVEVNDIISRSVDTSSEKNEPLGVLHSSPPVVQENPFKDQDATVPYSHPQSVPNSTLDVVNLTSSNVFIPPSVQHHPHQLSPQSQTHTETQSPFLPFSAVNLNPFNEPDSSSASSISSAADEDSSTNPPPTISSTSMPSSLTSSKSPTLLNSSSHAPDQLSIPNHPTSRTAITTEENSTWINPFEATTIANFSPSSSPSPSPSPMTTTTFLYPTATTSTSVMFNSGSPTNEEMFPSRRSSLDRSRAGSPSLPTSITTSATIVPLTLQFNNNNSELVTVADDTISTPSSVASNRIRGISSEDEEVDEEEDFETTDTEIDCEPEILNSGGDFDGAFGSGGDRTSDRLDPREGLSNYMYTPSNYPADQEFDENGTLSPVRDLYDDDDDDEDSEGADRGLVVGGEGLSASAAPLPPPSRPPPPIPRPSPAAMGVLNVTTESDSSSPSAREPHRNSRGLSVSFGDVEEFEQVEISEEGDAHPPPIPPRPSFYNPFISPEDQQQHQDQQYSYQYEQQQQYIQSEYQDQHNSNNNNPFLQNNNNNMYYQPFVPFPEPPKPYFEDPSGTLPPEIYTKIQLQKLRILQKSAPSRPSPLRVVQQVKSEMSLRGQGHHEGGGEGSDTSSEDEVYESEDGGVGFGAGGDEYRMYGGDVEIYYEDDDDNGWMYSDTDEESGIGDFENGIGRGDKGGMVGDGGTRRNGGMKRFNSDQNGFHRRESKTLFEEEDEDEEQDEKAKGHHGEAINSIDSYGINEDRPPIPPRPPRTSSKTTDNLPAPSSSPPPTTRWSFSSATLSLQAATASNADSANETPNEIYTFDLGVIPVNNQNDTQSTNTAATSTTHSGFHHSSSSEMRKIDQNYRPSPPTSASSSDDSCSGSDSGSVSSRWSRNSSFSSVASRESHEGVDLDVEEKKGEGDILEEKERGDMVEVREVEVKDNEVK
jgi:hypothetical protein